MVVCQCSAVTSSMETRLVRWSARTIPIPTPLRPSERGETATRRAGRGKVGDGRVVDEDVHVAELRGHRRHCLSARRVLRHVGHNRQHPRPRKVLPQSGAHRLERSVAEVESGEVRAFLEQHAAPLAADAPGCAAHQRHAPLQLHPAHGRGVAWAVFIFFKMRVGLH